MAAAFEFFAKLGTPYYCFHDRHLAPEGDTFAPFRDNLDKLAHVRATTVAEPGPDAAAYVEAPARYRELYPALAPLFHRG
jgi:hypothetical protein